MPLEDQDNGPIYCAQVAVLRVLEQDEKLKELAPSGVFQGEKPQNVTATLPWLVIEDVQFLPGAQNRRRVGTVIITISADHDSRTNKVLMLLMGRIYSLLDRNPSLVSSAMPAGWSCWESMNVSSNILTVNDDLRRMLVRYEFRMQECN